MKATFPYMGTTIIYKKLLEILGHEVVMPPKPSQRTIDLGVKHSPEFACFPLKVITGNYIEAIEKGADTIITSGGNGPCRAGFYGEIHKKILLNLGYDVEVIVIDGLFRNFKYVVKKLMKVKGKNSWLGLIRAIRIVYRMIKYLDMLEIQVQRLRAYERKRGEFNRAWEQIIQLFDGAWTVKQMKEARDKGQELIDSIEVFTIDEGKRLRIGIIGEIYVVMEPSINNNIEILLNEMGVEVERSQYLSSWVEYNLLPKFLNISHEKQIIKKGEPYIEIIIGGHAKQNIGHIVDYSERGFDGILHLMPFACLPELVSQSIIPRISHEMNIPVLTLSIDEQRGTANIQTRLEAFIDLVRNKKAEKTA